MVPQAQYGVNRTVNVYFGEYLQESLLLKTEFQYRAVYTVDVFRMVAILKVVHTNESRTFFRFVAAPSILKSD